MTLIEKLCVAWIMAVLTAVVTMASAAAFGAESATSTGALAQDAVDFAVRQIADSPDLYGVGAGLVVMLGLVLRNPAVRAAFPIVLEWCVSRYTRGRDARRARRKGRR